MKQQSHNRNRNACPRAAALLTAPFNTARPTARLNTLLMALLMALLTAPFFAACQQDTLATDPLGNTLNPDGTVTITHLNVDIDGAQATAANGAAQRASDAPTRTATGAAQATAATRADALPPAEEDAKVKTRFNTGDALHIYVVATQADANSGIRQFSTATLGADGRWALSPAIRLPQHAPDAREITIFYDGKTTAYNKFINNPTAAGFYDDNNYSKATTETGCHVNNGTTPWPGHFAYRAAARTDANGNAYFRDVLWCLGGTYFSDWDETANGSLAIGASGTLGVKMVHKNALVRITAIANQLGSPVARAELITTTPVAPFGSPYTTFTLRGTGEATATTPAPATASTPTPGTLPWQALIGTTGDTYAPHSIRLTLADGRQFAVALPRPPGHSLTDEGGFKAQTNRVYAYRLTLLPGSLTATPDTDPGSLAWNAVPDPAVPAGYTPIRTRADLEAIGATRDAMRGSYILMNDIDLSPKDPNSPTPEELWTPLGYKTDKENPDKESTCVTFYGRFNGNGHTLRGLTIRSDRQRLGLFAKLSGATVYNLHFSQAQVAGTTFEAFPLRGIGTLAGFAGESTISLCSATACTVAYSGDASTNLSANGIGIGALIGANSGTSSTNSTLTHCHATRCNVNAGNADFAGGLLGWNQSDTRLAACYTRACTVAGGTYAGGLLGGNNLCYPSILYGCYAATPTLTPGSGFTKALGALVGINFGVNGGSTDRTYVNLIASCYATPAATPAAGAGSTPAAPLKLVGINGTDNDTSTGNNRDGNARIIACLSPLAIAAQEEPNLNRTDAATTRSNAPRSNATTRAAGSNGGVPIVSITPRGTAQGYLPLLQDPALAQLVALTALGFSGSSTDASSLVLTMPRVVVNTTTAAMSVTEPGKTQAVTIPPGGIYTDANHKWSLHTHIWSTLKDDNNKGIAPMIGWQ